MSRGRPETPPSYIIDLDNVVDKIYTEAKASVVELPWTRLDVDIVVPVWETLRDETAGNTIWVTDNKIYISVKSRFVDYLTVERDKDRFYIYDRFKSGGYSHKNSYKQLMFEVPYVDDTAEPIYIPVYWRVN